MTGLAEGMSEFIFMPAKKGSVKAGSRLSVPHQPLVEPFPGRFCEIHRSSLDTTKGTMIHSEAPEELDGAKGIKWMKLTRQNKKQKENSN
jgi:hypothetical protein